MFRVLHTGVYNQKLITHKLECS